MLDRDVTGESLADRILSVIDHDERLAAMTEGARAFGRLEAASALADLVEEVVAS